jgi:hypothetical protein
VFELIQIIYWLALSTWFGGVLFVSIMAPVIIRTVRQDNPILPGVLSVNLEGQHGTLLAGSVVARIMSVLFPIELACAGGLLVGLVGQWVLLPRSGRELVLPLIRTALYVVALGLLLYHWRGVWPKVWKYRQEYVDHADEPDVANAALDHFDRYQTESTTVLRSIVFILLGMILFSANISRAITVSFR